ncbi:MAG: hypothetical protein D3914_05450 [Candidatus Electrothrix sp. LOE2]|nr:hypothetical protein [Candidatus Electrothrix sp. LOE2]
MSKQGGNWDKGVVLTIIALIIATLTLLATFTVPEIRDFFGMEEKPIPLPPEVYLLSDPRHAPPVQKVPAEVPNPPIPTEYAIHDNQSRFVEEAKTNLSLAFQDIDGQEFVRLIISPIGKKNSRHAMLTGDTEEFTSSVGVFLVQILTVDYDDKKVVVQVNRKP